MPALTISNVPEGLYRRIRRYAAEHGISVEDAAHRILDEATRPTVRLGDVVVAFARRPDVNFPEISRNGVLIEPADLTPADLPAGDEP